MVGVVVDSCLSKAALVSITFRYVLRSDYVLVRSREESYRARANHCGAQPIKTIAGARYATPNLHLTPHWKRRSRLVLDVSFVCVYAQKEN